MNADRTVRRLAVLVWLAGAVLGAAAEVWAAAGQAAPAPKSLIRKEWLKPPAGPAPPSRRDIFSPQGVTPSEEALSATPAGRPKSKPETNKEAEAEARPAFALRYIGFSRAVASKKIVALVLIESQASAVEEGDTVGAGYKIARITIKEIEIQAPDGTTLKFALVEGAQR
jgi:hypothetical protein